MEVRGIDQLNLHQMHLILFLIVDLLIQVMVALEPLKMVTAAVAAAGEVEPVPLLAVVRDKIILQAVKLEVVEQVLGMMDKLLFNLLDGCMKEMDIVILNIPELHLQK